MDEDQQDWTNDGAVEARQLVERDGSLDRPTPRDLVDIKVLTATGLPEVVGYFTCGACGGQPLQPASDSKFYCTECGLQMLFSEAVELCNLYLTQIRQMRDRVGGVEKKKLWWSFWR